MASGFSQRAVTILIVWSFLSLMFVTLTSMNIAKSYENRYQRSINQDSYIYSDQPLPTVGYEGAAFNGSGLPSDSSNPSLSSSWLSNFISIITARDIVYSTGYTILPSWVHYWFRLFIIWFPLVLLAVSLGWSLWL